MINMAKKKNDFKFKEYMENLELNKYVKIGFMETLKEGEVPKTLKEAEKLLKEYLGE